jgi:hypothetical protein
MSPTRRPSTVSGLRRGIGRPAEHKSPPAAAQAVVKRTKPIRVTLDLDPATYTDLNRWLGSAAIEVNPDHPRLSIAQALRAMIHVTTGDQAMAAAVIGQLQQAGKG